MSCIYFPTEHTCTIQYILITYFPSKHILCVLCTVHTVHIFLQNIYYVYGILIFLHNTVKEDIMILRCTSWLQWSPHKSSLLIKYYRTVVPRSSRPRSSSMLEEYCSVIFFLFFFSSLGYHTSPKTFKF
jgi:hypothetical protein